MSKKKVSKRKTSPRKKVTRKKKPIVKKEHPWRECPVDHHWVRSQVKHRKPSAKHPDGLIPYQAFCRLNPSHKSSIYSDELTLIADKYFDGLGSDLPVDPEFKKKGEGQFNDLIVGWTKYWNDIFKPVELLEPELVKALIATESGYRLNLKPKKVSKKAGMVRGILQITDETQKILDSFDSGEIKDHLVHVPQKELSDPNLSIAAGVRWLFHKKALASLTLGREASWFEAIVFYKSYKEKYLAGKPLKEMKGASDIVDAYQRIAGKGLKR